MQDVRIRRRGHARAVLGALRRIDSGGVTRGATEQRVKRHGSVVHSHGEVAGPVNGVGGVDWTVLRNGHIAKGGMSLGEGHGRVR